MRVLMAPRNGGNGNALGKKEIVEAIKKVTGQEGKLPNNGQFGQSQIKAFFRKQTKNGFLGC